MTDEEAKEKLMKNLDQAGLPNYDRGTFLMGETSYVTDDLIVHVFDDQPYVGTFDEDEMTIEFEESCYSELQHLPHDGTFTVDFGLSMLLKDENEMGKTGLGRSPGP